MEMMEVYDDAIKKKTSPKVSLTTPVPPVEAMRVWFGIAIKKENKYPNPQLKPCLFGLGIGARDEDLALPNNHPKPLP